MGHDRQYAIRGIEMLESGPGPVEPIEQNDASQLEVWRTAKKVQLVRAHQLSVVPFSGLLRQGSWQWSHSAAGVDRHVLVGHVTPTMA